MILSGSSGDTETFLHCHYQSLHITRLQTRTWLYKSCIVPLEDVVIVALTSDQRTNILLTDDGRVLELKGIVPNNAEFREIEELPVIRTLTGLNQNTGITTTMTKSARKF